MNVLVTASTSPEIEPFRKKNPDAEILIPGAGAIHTVYALTKRLLYKDIDLVIQAGIAGSFSEKYDPASVFAIEKDRFADTGMMEKGKFMPLTDTLLLNPHEHPYEDGWLINRNSLLRTCGLPLVDGITVNMVSDQLTNYGFNSKGMIESMEGAALHYVCLKENIPFLQLRSISNVAGERDKSKWNIEAAIISLNNALGLLYEKLRI